MSTFNLFITVIVLVFTINIATANPVNGKRFQNWGANCELVQQQEICYLQQVLSKKEQVLMVTVIGYTQAKKYPTIFFELPNDVQAGSPVTLRIDKSKPIQFDVNCSKQKCTAGFALDRRMLRQLKKGYTAKLSYVLRSKKINVLPISLMGITAGLKAVR